MEEPVYTVHLVVTAPDGDDRGITKTIPAEIMGVPEFTSVASRLVGSLVFAVENMLET